MAYKKWLRHFLRRGGMSIINRIRRSTGKVVKVVGTRGNRKDSGGMGRVFPFYFGKRCLLDQTGTGHQKSLAKKAKPVLKRAYARTKTGTRSKLAVPVLVRGFC